MLELVYDRYERRLRQRDPLAVARHRTTFNFARRDDRLHPRASSSRGASSRSTTSPPQLAKALLASSAVLALFAGLAFSTPLSNLGSGLLVSFTQPLRLGDRITVGGETGFVEDMALIYTTLVTDDARRIFIPNTQLTTNMIVNRTIKDPRRAITGRFPVSIDTPIPEAREALLGAIAGPPGTHAEHARVIVGEISDRTVWLEAARTGRSTRTSSRSRASFASAGSSRCASEGFWPAEGRQPAFEPLTQGSAKSCAAISQLVAAAARTDEPGVTQREEMPRDPARTASEARRERGCRGRAVEADE